MVLPDQNTYWHIYTCGKCEVKLEFHLAEAISWIPSSNIYSPSISTFLGSIPSCCYSLLLALGTQPSSCSSSAPPLSGFRIFQPVLSLPWSQALLASRSQFRLFLLGSKANTNLPYYSWTLLHITIFIGVLFFIACITTKRSPFIVCSPVYYLSLYGG